MDRYSHISPFLSRVIVYEEAYMVYEHTLVCFPGPGRVPYPARDHIFFNHARGFGPCLP